MLQLQLQLQLQLLQPLNTPHKGTDGEPEAAGANVGKEDEPQPDKDEEAALKTQAEEARKTLEEIKK